jgi:O-antigen ligase
MQQPGYTLSNAPTPALGLRANIGATSAKINKIYVRLIYIFIMLWVARIGLFIRQRDNYAAIDMLALIQIGIVGLIFVFFFLSPTRNFRRQIKNSSLKFYFFYLVLGALSAFWSANPKFSMYRAMEAFALSAAVLYFCMSARTVQEGIQRVQLIMWPSLLLNWLGLILLVGFSWRLRLNGFGAMAALTACFFVAWILADRKSQSWKKFFQAGLGVFFIFISYSLASWWSLWFGVCYCVFFTRHKAMVIFLILVGATLFFMVEQDTRQDLILFDKKYENLQSMTGRDKLWRDYWAASRERPFLGFGFAVGAREVGYRYTTNTHNVFFGALLGLGWVGVAILGLFFISLARELLRYRHFRHPPWLACASAIAAGCLNTMSVSILGEQFNLAAVIFMALLGLHMVFLREAKWRVLSEQETLMGPRQLIPGRR